MFKHYQKLDVCMKVVGTLAVGAAGGWVFLRLSMPLPWLIGSMVTCTFISMYGTKIHSTAVLRPFAIPILGIMLGSGFTPDVLPEIKSWAATLGLLCLFVIALTAVGALTLKYFKIGDSVTVFFSATPGGFSEMVLLAESFNGNERIVSLIHATRILITILVIPIWFYIFQGYVPPPTSAQGTIDTLALNDLFILITCALVGYFGGKKLKIPAAALLGPAILSATAHITGITAAKPPGEALVITQLIIGTSVGSRFIGVTMKEIKSSILAGIALSTFMLTSAALVAYCLSIFLQIEFPTLWLAFAPGGLAEMTLISLTMGIDVAFVSTHHMARIMVMVLMAPIAFKLINKAFGLASDKTSDYN